jgi:hypothetical protein
MAKKPTADTTRALKELGITNLKGKDLASVVKAVEAKIGEGSTDANTVGASIKTIQNGG